MNGLPRDLPAWTCLLPGWAELERGQVGMALLFVGMILVSALSPTVWTFMIYVGAVVHGASLLKGRAMGE